MNVATIKVAEMIGYDKVVQFAKRPGSTKTSRLRPPWRIGSYDTTPMEIAGAYTFFANQGIYINPTGSRPSARTNGSALCSEQAGIPNRCWIRA